jgi:hypothetical protein
MKEQFLETCQKQNILIEEHIPLAPLCSFRTGGDAELFYNPSHHHELQNILILAETYHIPITVIGSGSNTLSFIYVLYHFYSFRYFSQIFLPDIAPKKLVTEYFSKNSRRDF